MKKLMAGTVATFLLALSGCAMAAQSDDTSDKSVLSAKASNPETMGWMQGFPPSDDKTIRFTDSDYFAFPKLRWTVCHFRELMPTAGVRNGSGAASNLPAALDPAINDVTLMSQDDAPQ